MEYSIKNSWSQSEFILSENYRHSQWLSVARKLQTLIRGKLLQFICNKLIGVTWFSFGHATFWQSKTKRLATKSEEKFQITCFQLKITSFFEIVLSCKHFVQLIINKKASRCLQDLADRAKWVIVRVRTKHWSLSLNEKFIFVWLSSALHFPKYKSDRDLVFTVFPSYKVEKMMQLRWTMSKCLKLFNEIPSSYQDRTFCRTQHNFNQFFFRKIWSWRIKSFYSEGLIRSS